MARVIYAMTRTSQSAALPSTGVVLLNVGQRPQLIGSVSPELVEVTAPVVSFTPPDPSIGTFNEDGAERLQMIWYAPPGRVFF